MADNKKEIKPVDLNDSELIEETVEGAELPAVVNQGTMAIGEVSGEVGVSDIKFPSLRVIQKMSDNPDKLDEGTITLDNTMVVQNAKGECRISVLSFVKYYREVLPFGGGIPQTFLSVEEAQEAGFRVARSKQDRDSGVPLVEDAARALIAIEKPEGAMDRAFPYVIDGVRMTTAIWWIQSTAYRNIAKYILSKLHFELRATGLLPAVWKVTATKVKGAKGDYYVPNIALLNEERSPKFIEDLKSQINL